MATSVTPRHYPFGAIPAGYDPNLARQLAPQVAENVRSRQYSYDRGLVERLQRAAGNDVDGLYGPYTVSTLEYYGVSRPPGHLFKMGDEIPPYRPPTADGAEITIDVPGPGGSVEVVPGDGAPVQQRAGVDLLSALAVLGTAVSVGAGSLRGRFFSSAVPLSGHRSRRSRRGK